MYAVALNDAANTMPSTRTDLNNRRTESRNCTTLRKDLVNGTPHTKIDIRKY